MADDLAYQDHRQLIVKTSWQRCKNQYQLDRGVHTSVDALSETEIKTRQDTLHHFLDHSTEVIQAVRHLAKQGHYCMLIADHSGIAVDEYADTAESIECQDYGLIRGSQWEEHNIGTNGIGTCLASKHCITVSGAEHYVDHLNKFTCTAAPIFNVDEEVLGAINISRLVNEDYVESFFTHSFIQEAAKQISANIFVSAFKDKNIISCSSSSNVSLYESKALLAFDDNGIIEGATKDCLEILDGMHLHDIVGQSLNDIIPEPIEKVLSDKNALLEIKQGPLADTFVKSLCFKTNATPSRASKTRLPQPIKAEKPALNGHSERGEKLDKFAGADPNVRRCVEVSKRLINKRIPLLLLGETGVGKDTLAKLLHETSERRDHPFVALNCAAIPPSLMDSELFGYMPGTFTDGLKDGKTGKILASHGGTLFLDEIGDMPFNLQAHLLRVLEEREVTPLGAVEPIPVDIKVICATHKNIHELVKQGLFRQDLLYRIKGAEIKLPPLRERSNIEDIIKVILDTLGTEETKDITISNEVMDVFHSYFWPGNIRELKTVLQYALCFCETNEITLDTLPEELLSDLNGTALDHSAQDSLIAGGQTQALSLEDSKSASELKVLNNLLIKNSWNITATAEQLNISRSTLHRKIKKYGIIAPNKATD